MGLYLEVVQGEQKGERFRIFDGAKLGRNSGDIALNDKKISSYHAQIEVKSDGALCLIDKGSTNGISIKGEKVKSILLVPGVTFTAGRTVLKVIETQEVVEQKSSGVEAVNPRHLHDGWLKDLAIEIPKMMSDNQVQMDRVFAFEKLVKLEFLSGVQDRKTVYLGYGPRKFGSRLLDVELLEPRATGITFEIVPDGPNVKIISRVDDTILLNDKKFNEEILKDNDIIRVGATEIKVSLFSVE